MAVLSLLLIEWCRSAGLSHIIIPTTVDNASIQDDRSDVYTAECDGLLTNCITDGDTVVTTVTTRVNSFPFPHSLSFRNSLFQSFFPPPLSSLLPVALTFLQEFDTVDASFL
jgi:hypothetical protein